MEFLECGPLRVANHFELLCLPAHVMHSSGTSSLSPHKQGSSSSEASIHCPAGAPALKTCGLRREPTCKPTCIRPRERSAAVPAGQQRAKEPVARSRCVESEPRRAFGQPRRLPTLMRACRRLIELSRRRGPPHSRRRDCSYFKVRGRALRSGWQRPAWSGSSQRPLSLCRLYDHGQRGLLRRSAKGGRG